MYSLYSASSFAVASPADIYIYEIVALANGIASVSSDNILRLHDPLALQTPLASVPKIHDEVTVLKALDAENSVVCTAGRDGKVKIWDLRNGGMVGEIRCDNNAPVLSLGCSASSYSIAAGTELTNHQASVVIWDTRNLQAPRVQYVESHSDDVTELQYHPSQPAILLSGSTDGLVNLYDTTITDEEETLHQTINHGSSIHHAGFLNNTDIFALSHDEKFSMYEMVTNPGEEVEESPAVNFGDLREPLGCEYVVNVMSRPDGGAVLGAGNHSREEFDLIQMTNSAPWRFVPESRVTLKGGHGSEIVRSFCFLDQHKTILSAGEDSHIRAWTIE